MHGAKDVNIYTVLVVVPGKHTELSTTIQAVAYPPLDVGGIFSAHDMNLVALLGRDYLRYVRLVYDGMKGIVEVYHQSTK